MQIKGVHKLISLEKRAYENLKILIKLVSRKKLVNPNTPKSKHVSRIKLPFELIHNQFEHMKVTISRLDIRL